MFSSGKQKDPPDSKKPKNVAFFWWLLFVSGFFIVPALLDSLVHGPVQLSWQEFQKKVLVKNAVEKIVVVNNEHADIFLKQSFAKDTAFRQVFSRDIGSESKAGPHYRIVIGSVETFEHKLEEAAQVYSFVHDIPVTYERTSNWVSTVLSWILPLLLLLFLWNFMSRRTGRMSGSSSAFTFGRSTAKLLDRENKSSITFEDVAGLEEAESEVKEVVDFLKSPDAFTRLGAKIPKGIILVGPPGTGKTLLAKAVAGEAQVPFFHISGSEFVEMFVGVGASRVRDLFRRAKEKAPCIVFIDEIDAIGRSRGKNAYYTGSNDERESTLNQLLTEMDGFDTNSGVIVLAATNRGDMLDPALLRPGRFDRHIYLELPNIQEREAIFNVHLRRIIKDEKVDVHFLSVQTPGFSGADIANICNEAALIAARRQKDKVYRQDFLDAIDRAVAGPEKKSKIISKEEKQMIAFHEAGHALISWLLRRVDPLVKVSIIPRGKSLGAAWYLPEEKQLRTAPYFREHLCAILGGRAAEDIIFHEVSSGALDDLEKATREAYMMVAFYGFNEKIGPVSFYDSTGMRDTVFQKPYSESTARLIDEEVRLLIKETYEKAKGLLLQRKEQLEQVAALLMKNETIFKEDLEIILGTRPGAMIENDHAILIPE